MTDDLPTAVGSLSANLTELEDDLEADLKELLDHPCKATVEDLDTETGKVTLRVDPDLAVLRDRLKEANDYDAIEIGIDGGLTIHVWPPNNE